MRLGAIRGDIPTLVAEQGGRCFRIDGIAADPLAALLDESVKDAIASRLKAGAPEIDVTETAFAPPVPQVGKIICVGLNYADHAAESPYDKPNYPIFFLRVDTSLIGHNEPLIRPRVSEHFDYEAEYVAVIGKGGRAIAEDAALDHVAAYSVFNDGSIRDYQFKGPQWTLGKNFDGTGAFGPYLVTPDEIPTGAVGLDIKTLLNGQVMQSANTDDLLFPLPELIARVSEAMTLRPGDIIVTGTPAGVGFARKPPVFMKHGDVCEIVVEGIGTLRNPVRDEAA